MVHLIMIAPKHYWLKMKLAGSNFNITLTYWEKKILKFCNEDVIFFHHCKILGLPTLENPTSSLPPPPKTLLTPT
jgi:hypothetical protein